LPAIAGSTASLLICSPTGAMMNIVRNNASPMRIWFDGISCVPSACRRKWNTMAMRVKQVIVTRMAGRNEISVSSRTI
jgi:hypothetical protein